MSPPHILKMRSAFVNPLWFQLVMHGEHQAKAVDERTVELKGELLDVHPSDHIRLRPGQVVHVWLDRHFWFITDEEKAQMEEEARRQADEEKERIRQHKNRLREEAEAFNATLNIPVKWTTGVNLVLSGLSETSAGDGYFKNTVQHIMLLEDLKDGRLVRHKGGFLCNVKRRGRLKDRDASYHVDGDGNRYTPKVTCKACLRIARRWSDREGDSK